MKMQEIRAENPSTLVNIMGTECPPLQFLREYTTNSIEAINRAKCKKGIIHWGIDPFYLKEHGVEKLCIIDNGDGMSLDDCVHHIATLGVEGANHSHGEDANFGVGGKISAFKNNPEGIIYKTKRAGKCSLVIISKVNGKYVIKEAKAIGNNKMPPELQNEKSGTMVTFLGNTPEENTARRVSDKAVKEQAGFKFLIQYLNTKFFNIPSHIKITALDSNDSTGGTKNRTIQGVAAILNKDPIAKGEVNLNGFTAYWWIQKDDFSKNNGTIMGNIAGSNGHIAIMMKDEIYERPMAPYAYLPRFGIYAGMRQVFIYLEPNGANVFAAIARTRLIINGSPVPINELGTQFNENMPKKLRDFIDSMMGVNQSSTVKEILKRFLNKFKVPKFIQGKKGTFDGELVIGSSVTGDGETRGEKFINDTENDGTNENPKPINGEGKKDKDIYGKGKKGKSSREDGMVADYPNVIWQSVKPQSDDIGIRESGDMEDRVGKFIPNTNTLIINADFKPIEEVVKFWKGKIESVTANDEKVIRRAVQRGYELTLVDAIIHTKALGRANAEGWTEETVNRVLSDEFSLTSIAAPQFHLTSTLRNEIRRDIGRLS